MSPVCLRVQRLDPRAVVPTRAHPGDAGLDLCALEPGALAAGERVSVRTGLAVQIPEGMAGLVLPRSGLARDHGIALVNAPGLIDSGYRGEIRVLLLNSDPARAFCWEAGQRIAQLVVISLPVIELAVVEDLRHSARSARGFGSSGR
jgi:dUTP pyrophosphatase